MGGHQACPISAIEIGLGKGQTQQFSRGSGFIQSCTFLFARRRNAAIHTSVLPNTAGDEQADPCQESIVTLTDLGYVHHRNWTCAWEYTGRQVTRMLEDLCARGHYMESAKASAHMDGSALEHGVDICGSRGTVGFVVEKELES